MNRRGFLKSLILTPFAFVANTAVEAVPDATQTLLLNTVIAGFQYYRGERIWGMLAEQDALDLVREPDNRYDDMAVAVFRKGEKLGYVPRRDNVVIAQMMDRGTPLSARISNLTESDDPWERIGVQVWMSNVRH